MTAPTIRERAIDVACADIRAVYGCNHVMANRLAEIAFDSIVGVLREPSVPMIEAGRPEINRAHIVTSCKARNTFTAMLDEAAK